MSLRCYAVSAGKALGSNYNQGPGPPKRAEPARLQSTHACGVDDADIHAEHRVPGIYNASIINNVLQMPDFPVGTFNFVLQGML
jgi:hypothetical protein